MVAPNNIEEHMHAIDFRRRQTQQCVDFGVVIEPRMHDNSNCVVHWRALGTCFEKVKKWKEHHGCADVESFKGCFSVLCDHVQWMNDLETSNLERMLSFMKSKIIPNKTL